MKEMKYEKLLECYVRDRKIFIDTCSLLHPKVNDFFDNIIPYLTKYNNKILVSSATYHELEKHANNKKDIALAKRARESLEMLVHLWKRKAVEIRGEKDEVFADNVFLYVFAKFRLSHNLLLITQDKALARDIEALNLIESAKTNNNIVVRKINNNSQLEEVY